MVEVAEAYGVVRAVLVRKEEVLVAVRGGAVTPACSVVSLPSLRV